MDQETVDRFCYPLMQAGDLNSDLLKRAALFQAAALLDLARQMTRIADAMQAENKHAATLAAGRPTAMAPVASREPITFLRFEKESGAGYMAVFRWNYTSDLPEERVSRAQVVRRLANLISRAEPHDETQRILAMWPKDEAL